MKTTTDRVKRVVEKFGYRYELVERFNHHTMRRSDFGGFADVLCWRRLTEISPLVMDWWRQEYGTEGLFLGCLAIQTCVNSTINEHLQKVVHGEPRDGLRDWLIVGNRFEIWGWRSLKKRKKDGTKGSSVEYLPVVMRLGWNSKKKEFEYADDSEVEVFGWERR
jgi:hypothetical protein